MNFYRANLENKDLRGQNFDGADFRKANLRMTILEDVSCEPGSVKKIGWGWLSIVGMLLFSSGTDVAPFSKEEMKSTNFSEADLTGTNLKHAKLREVNFHRASLRNANLSKAILINADLSEADLSNANLSYADMSGALLYKTNLEGADPTGAKLDGTDFEGANLKNAILHNIDLRKAKYLSSAIMPEPTTSNGDTTDSVGSEFAAPIQSRLSDASDPIPMNSFSGRNSSKSVDRSPIIVGTILGVLSAILCAYLVPILMFGIEALGYHSVAQYLTQVGFILCIPVISLWSVPFGIFGSLFGQRIGLKMKSPVASIIFMITGGLIGSGLGFLLGIPLMIIVVGLGS